MQVSSTHNSTSAISELLLDKAAEMTGKKPEQPDETDQQASAEVEQTVIEQHDDAQDAQHGDEQQKLETDETGGADDPVTLDDLAATLDVPTKEVYSVNIPIGGGEMATLGEMKDAYKRLQKFDTERSEFDEHRRGQENELLVARRQAEDLVNLLIDRGKITPNDLQQVENINRARITKENRAMLSVIPAWHDQEVRARDFDAFVELGAEYGFSDVEIRNIPDHRILKMLYDFSAARRAKKSTNGKTPPKNIGGARAPTQPAPTLKQRIAAAKKQGGRAKTTLIADMITGKVEV